MFKEMSEAYAILGDEDKRAKYDKYGHDAPEDGTVGILIADGAFGLIFVSH